MRARTFKFSPAAYMRGECWLPDVISSFEASLNYSMAETPKPYWNDENKWLSMTSRAMAYADALAEVADMLGLATMLWRKPQSAICNLQSATLEAA